MKKRYRVTLTEDERLDLQKLVSTGKAAAKKLVRARIVLLADQEEGGPACPILRLWQPWDVDELPSNACGNNSSKTAWRLRCSPRRGSVCTSVGSMVRRKLIWWRWPAGVRRRAGRGGRCGCWRIAWWRWNTWQNFPTRRCGGR